jgi:antitoxin ParD1/3/4
MSATRTITIEVPEEVALRMDAEVAAGNYADASDVVTESVRAQLHQSRYDGSDPEIERWLQEQVLPTYERWQREKTPGIPAEEVLDRLRARRAARTKLA